MNCKSSTVEPGTKIVVNGVEHAGLVTHKCHLPDHTTDVECECACGHKWTRNYK